MLECNLFTQYYISFFQPLPRSTELYFCALPLVPNSFLIKRRLSLHHDYFFFFQHNISETDFSFFHLHLKILCRPSSCCSSCCQALINKMLYHQYYSKQGYRKHFLILLLRSHHMSLQHLPIFSLHYMS